MARRTAIIIGAGPAGLTAAYELLSRTDIRPVVLERSEYVGGISRTVEHNGNRMDIGGHRFFSKSDRVMDWWLAQLPQEKGNESDSDSEVMLTRRRKSRIYFLRQFFEYPIQLSFDTLSKLGITRTIRIALSYARATLFPCRKADNLETFFVNRFGRELYRTFFKSYTEKVWGVPCRDISAEWGAQRIKGLSIGKAILHFLKQIGKHGSDDVAQKDVETSLIERFLYPKYGPGQMWEKVAREVVELGGEVVTNCDVNVLELDGDRVVAVRATDGSGLERRYSGDYFFSTTSVKELVAAMKTGGAGVPDSVDEVASALHYRDFIAVGLLVDKLKVRDSHGDSRIRDNWIYIQEPDVEVGRLQLFNNWSPSLVADPSKVWLGAEYFCYEGDRLWNLTDQSMADMAGMELAKIGIINREDVSDYKVVRMAKAYPAYFGAYSRFDVVRSFLDGFPNLFLIGRNGTHKYNNQDHSMLTAMVAVDNIAAGSADKDSIWNINTEQDYHEARQS